MAQPIGIFVSGIGGLSVLKALRVELPNEHFIYIADSGYAPYGERDDAHVIERSLKIAAYLVKQDIKALVVACNTATAAAIEALRATYPSLPIIGVEPALKPAVAISKTKRIAVMATRSTLGSTRFAALLAAQSSHAQFVLLPCDGLAEAIEQSVQDQNATKTIAACARIMDAAGAFNAEKTAKTAFGNLNVADTIVLGCTHYPFAGAHILAMAGPGVQLLDTGEAVARQTRRLLSAVLATQAAAHPVTLASTGDPSRLEAAAAVWMGMQADVQTLLI